jgi:uncharacterized protein YlxW (UPF0749 family)
MSHDERSEESPETEPGPVSDASGPAEPSVPGTPWRRLGAAFRPRMTRAQVLATVLCGVLGFALVVQLRQTQQGEFTNLRQADLVRILDDVTRRSEDLEREASALRQTEFELRSSASSEQAAIDLAEQNVATLGILSGRLPAQGPGIEIHVVEGAEPVRAARLFNLLQELRNAGAEAVEVNGIRMVTSSDFTDAADGSGVVVDGRLVESPFTWLAIGDPKTLEPALDIPGGAMQTIRSKDAQATIVPRDDLVISAVHEPEDPTYATPVPVDE